MHRLWTFLVLLMLSTSIYAQQSRYEMTFVYWMPYDNNLSNWADSIYSMIGAGLSSANIAVTIQKDVAGTSGMTRSVLTHDGVRHEAVNSDLSANGKSFRDYLIWVASNIPSDKYAIVFLDHGGKLDEIGLDESPDYGFLRVDSARWAIQQFNQLTTKKTELVYLQVCTKGSIEPLYELQDVARYTMFSQTTLGAPNYYYQRFFDHLSESYAGNYNGLEIARLITDYERSDMYQSLVCIDNSKFDKFSRSFQRFLSDHARADEYRFEDNQLLFYYGQTYFDLGAYIRSFRGVDTKRLLKSIRKLVVMNRINPDDDTMTGYSGISLLAMQNDYLDKLQQYNHLRFFKSFKMNELYLSSMRLLNK